MSMCLTTALRLTNIRSVLHLSLIWLLLCGPLQSKTCCRMGRVQPDEQTAVRKTWDFPRSFVPFLPCAMHCLKCVVIACL